MRKLKIVEHLSLDGVMQSSGTDDAFPFDDWCAPYRSSEGRASMLAAHGERFDLLLGRRTYDDWAGFWPNAPAGPFADRINAATKFVVTHRPAGLGWGPSEALHTDLAYDIGRIKAEDGPDIVLAGSCSLVPAVLALGLAEAIVLAVYPVVLGSGKRLFVPGTPARALQLVGTQSTPTGVLINRYDVVGPLA